MKTYRKITIVWLAAVFLISAMTAAAAGKREPVDSAGGTLKVGTQPVNNLDPHFATSIADILLLEQVFDHLVYIVPDRKASNCIQRNDLGNHKRVGNSGKFSLLTIA